MKRFLVRREKMLMKVIEVDAFMINPKIFLGLFNANTQRCVRNLIKK